MCCVVIGAGAGYGAQQTGEFLCSLSVKETHTLSHHAQDPLCVYFVTAGVCFFAVFCGEAMTDVEKCSP